MKRAYKERCYPTDEQAELLAKSFGCARFVYNNTLRYRTDSYYKKEEKVSHSDAEKRLIQVKKEFAWLTEISSVILQQSLCDQQQASVNFWAGRAKYPSFKKKADRQSIRLTIAKSEESLSVKWNRELSSEPTSVTISKDSAGRYFVSMLCEFEPIKRRVSSKMVGVDFGLNHLFITCSSPQTVSNKRASSSPDNIKPSWRSYSNASASNKKAQAIETRRAKKWHASMQKLQTQDWMRSTRHHAN